MGPCPVPTSGTYRFSSRSWRAACSATMWGHAPAGKVNAVENVVAMNSGATPHPRPCVSDAEY